MWGTTWGTIGAPLGHHWGTMFFLETVHIDILHGTKVRLCERKCARQAGGYPLLA